MNQVISLENLVVACQKQRVSDIHFRYDVPIKIRLHGQIKEMAKGGALTDEDILNYIKQMGYTQEYLKKMGDKEIDGAITVRGIRCRLNIYRQQEHYSIALRILNDTIPEFENLGLHPICKEFTQYNNGIVIITGETGSGKSTTLAALIDYINQNDCEHIITLEDPIEYVHRKGRCLINQRQIGRDTESFEAGLMSALRQDPDIILVGEMRTPEVIETALTAAETGHLVFATLHTNSAADTIDRIVGVFPAEKQQQIRTQLSMCIKAIVAQQLVPKKDGTGRVLAYEIMISNPAFRSLIKDGKTSQIKQQMQTSSSDGNITMDSCLIRLAKQGLISKQEAVERASERDLVARQI